MKHFIKMVESFNNSPISLWDVKSLNKEVRREKVYRITSYTLHRGLDEVQTLTDCVNSCHKRHCKLK
jgi:hypothetical protein